MKTGGATSAVVRQPHDLVSRGCLRRSALGRSVPTSPGSRGASGSCHAWPHWWQKQYTNATVLKVGRVNVAPHFGQTRHTSAINGTDVQTSCPWPVRLRAGDGEHKAKLLPSDAVPPRKCIVTVTDLRGIRHPIEVSADTLFDAAARGLSPLRSDDWTELIGPATRLEIQVLQPVVTHTVTVQQLDRWANSTAAGPDERIRKAKLRALLVGHSK
jgi:hypothetical protein